MNAHEGTGNGSDGKLLKILGVTFGIAVTVGGMIGLGILRTPGTIAAQLGSSWLILAVWVVGGVYALLGVLQVAELGTTIPKVGGPYVFADRAFGHYAGFAVGWMDWIAYPAGMALGAITIGEYFALLVPSFSPYITHIAVLSLLLLGVSNAFGLRVGSSLQEITSLAKALVFFVLIGACFIVGGGGSSAEGASTVPAPLGPIAVLGAFVVAFQGVTYAYDGWYAAVYFSEENRDAASSIPKAMIFGVLSVMAIYLLFNLALLYVLPMETLAASSLPAADAATVAFGRYGSNVVTVLAIVSLLSISNANLLVAPRILLGMSRRGAFFARAAKVNEGGTPVVALAITLGCSLPLVIIGTFEKLLAVSAFLYIGIYLSAFAATFKLRRSEPDLARPFKAWGYPWTTLLVFIGSVAFLASAAISDTENSIYALGLIILSYPFYLLIRRFSGRETIASG